MPRKPVSLEVNGATCSPAVRAYDVLLDTLREDLNLTGTKRGCDMGTCGCCTVWVDGEPRLSCLTLTREVEGRSITTVEGLRGGRHALHPVQRLFAEVGGSQCGFCTPGFLMTSAALIRDRPDPSDDEIRRAIGGNMCRCTGYQKIVEAVREAAREVREAATAGSPAAGDHTEPPAGDGAPGRTPPGEEIP